MAFTTNPYCQLADVKLALNISSTDTTKDAFLSELIVQAQAYLDREIGYPFQTDGTVAAPATRVYSGNNMEQLYIDDCIQVTQVLEYNYNLYLGSNGLWQSNAVSVTDITADVVLGPENTTPGYLLYRLTGLPFMRGRQNYKVLGVFGEPAIPSDITRACIRLTCHYYKMRDTNYADTISAQGGVREKYHKAVPDDVCEIIENYKRRLFLCQ